MTSPPRMPSSFASLPQPDTKGRGWGELLLLPVRSCVSCRRSPGSTSVQGVTPVEMHHFCAAAVGRLSILPTLAGTCHSISPSFRTLALERGSVAGGGVPC